MSSPKNFKVIVVGGGPVGLLAAHILAQANIDFTVLEAYKKIIPEPGSSIAFWPQTNRILDQLGLLAALTPRMNTMLHSSVINQNGQVMHEGKTFEAGAKK